MPRKEYVDLKSILQDKLPSKLEKDLQENERICPVCNGLGVVLEDNVYGVVGDTSELGKKFRFPYRRQAFTFCPNCYNGVQKLCPYCGKPYKDISHLHCDCEGQKKADEKARAEKWEKLLSKAKEVQENEIDTMLYCVEVAGYFDSISDFKDYWYDFISDIGGRPQRLWVTKKEEISIDADSLIEDVCSELHEDAKDNCDIDGLQKLLDSWCKEQTGATTYYPSYEKYVVIDW